MASGTYVAGKPASGNLQVFNSFTELKEGKNRNGKTEFIKVSSFTFDKVILEPSTMKIIMESNNAPSYFAQNAAPFNLSVIYNGQRKYFTYRPNQMLMQIDWTTDFKRYADIKRHAELEDACEKFKAKAASRAKELAALAIMPNLTPTTRQYVANDIKFLEEQINGFKSKLPPGFYVQGLSMSPSQAANIGEPISLTIIFIVSIIVAGVVVAAISINEAIQNTNRFTSNLAARDNNIRAIKDQAMRDQALADSVKNDNTNLTTSTNAAAAAQESGGMLGQIKQIAIAAVVIVALKELVPVLTKKTNG
jgi:hypothetical protein